MLVQQGLSATNWPPIISVAELNQRVAKLLEQHLPLTWVSGEISNFTRAASGHWYFTLKDAQAQVRSVMFRGRAQYADFLPREGDKVEVRAIVSLYTPRGDYQINVEAIRRAGIGNLFEAFLRLKEKLAAAGCFDAARKRPIPRFVRHIGIITSLQAAALHDVLSALQRRAPHVELIIYPVPVQGVGAAEKMVQAIATANRRAECQVLLLCRGGGSMEDLWQFNEEVLAHAILNSQLPVISGIGHETDFTIADFCADLRAPTPTAAAELAASPRRDWLNTLDTLADRLRQTQHRQLQQRLQQLDWLARRLPNPAAFIKQQRLRLTSLGKQLESAKQAPLQRARHSVLQQTLRLAAQAPQTAVLRARVTQRQQTLAHQFSLQQQQRRQALQALAGQLELLNPQRTLERGYAIIQDQHGVIVRQPEQLHSGKQIKLKLANGQANIEIASVQIIETAVESPTPE